MTHQFAEQQRMVACTHRLRATKAARRILNRRVGRTTHQQRPRNRQRTRTRTHDKLSASQHGMPRSVERNCEYRQHILYQLSVLFDSERWKGDFIFLLLSQLTT